MNGFRRGAIGVGRKTVLDQIGQRFAVRVVVAAVDHERVIDGAPYHGFAARQRLVNEVNHLVQANILHPRLGASVGVVRGSPAFEAVTRKIKFRPRLAVEHGARQLSGAYRSAVEMGHFGRRAETCLQLAAERLLFVRGILKACELAFDR